MAVTESKTGTMPEAEDQPKGSSAAAGKTPELGKVSPKQEPRLYTQEQMDAMVHAIKSDAGRKAKEIEVERDTLKSQLSAKEGEIEGIQSEREHLQKQLEDLASDDPKKFDLLQKDKELRDRMRSYKSNISDLEKRENALKERELRVNAFDLELLIESVADEYEDGDSDKLKKAVSILERPSEEQIRIFADILWKPKQAKGEKKEAGEKKEPLKPYSGHTEGGDTVRALAKDKIRSGWDKIHPG